MSGVFGKKIYKGRSLLENGYLVFSGHKIVELSKAPKGIGRAAGEGKLIQPIHTQRSTWNG